MSDTDSNSKPGKMEMFPSLHPLGNYYREKHVNEKRNLAQYKIDPEPQLPIKKIHSPDTESNFKKFERARYTPNNNEPLIPNKPIDYSQPSKAEKNAELLMAMYQDDVKKTLSRMCVNEIMNKQNEEKMKANIPGGFLKGLEFLGNLFKQNKNN